MLPETSRNRPAGLLLAAACVCVLGATEHISASPATLRAPVRQGPACAYLSAVVSTPFTGIGPPPIRPSRSSSAAISSTEPFLSDYLLALNGIQSLSAPLQWHSTFYSTVCLREHLFSLSGEPHKLLELRILTGLAVTCPRDCTPSACSVSA